MNNLGEVMMGLGLVAIGISSIGYLLYLLSKFVIIKQCVFMDLTILDTFYQVYDLHCQSLR